MENTFKGYINYGCLGAEKYPVFTAGAPAVTAVTSEPVEYTVPEYWGLSQTETGNIIVTAPWGWDYDPNELLTVRRGNEKEALNYPYFRGYNSDGNFFSEPVSLKKI